MSGNLKLEILFGNSTYVMVGPECERILEALDAVPELGSVTGTLRDDLRKAISGGNLGVALPNPFPDESEDPTPPWLQEKIAEKLDLPSVVKNVAKENEEACGDCRVPRCRFCDLPGKRAGGRKDLAGRTVERYYVCETEGCLAAKMRTPQPAKLFSGGAE